MRGLAVALAVAMHIQTGASRTALVTIVDPRNQPIIDVGPDDFVVREAGQPRDVLTVNLADYPIVVLLDTSAEARSDFDDIRRAAQGFVARLGLRPVAIGTLGDPPEMLTAFDDDRTRVVQQLAAVGAQPAAGTMLLEGIASAARLLRATGAPFSAIVVISNTAKDDTRNAQRDLLATVLQSGAFVHVVANRSGADPAKLRLTEPLRGLAEQTHGQFTTIYAALSYQVALERLADRLAAELMVEYLVPPGSSAADVKLGVNLPGARVNGLGAR